MRFAGKDEKAQAVFSFLVHALGCLPNLCDPSGMFHVGHRGQSLQTVGSLQQRHGGEGGGMFHS